MQNPFLLLLIAIFFALLLTLLPFSNTFPRTDLNDWIAISPLLSLLSGSAIIYKSLGNFNYPLLSFDDSNAPSFSPIIKTIILFSIGEIILAGAPILGSVDYKEFGIPFFHVVVYGGLIYLAIIGSAYSASKKYQSYGFKLSAFIAIYSICILSRHLLMILLISFFIAYLRSTKLNFIRLTILALACLITIWLFGLLGSIRMANILEITTYEADLYILEAGGASEFYIKSGLGAAFFWFWLYLASPIFNLLNTIKLQSTQNNLLTDFINFIIFEIFPQTISKRIADFFNIPSTNQYLIADHLNVSTAFAGSFSNLGWIGIILYIYWMMVFVLFLRFSSNNSNGFLSINFASCIMLLSLFDNMLITPSVFVTAFLLAIHGTKIKAAQ